MDVSWFVSWHFRSAGRASHFSRGLHTHFKAGELDSNDRGSLIPAMGMLLPDCQEARRVRNAVATCRERTLNPLYSAHIPGKT